MNGHFIDSANESPQDFFDAMRTLSALPQPVGAYRNKNAFCATCSQPTINACTHCNSPILVDESKPSYCRFCGKPFPWTETALTAAMEYTDELEGLSIEEKATLKATFDDLTVDTPRTELAAHRFKKFIRKIGPVAGDVLTKIIVNVATEAAKKGMGFG